MKISLKEEINNVEKSPFFIGKEGILLNKNCILASTPIKDVKFNVRFFHVICARDFKYLIDVLNTDYNLILKFRNCGIKSVLDARMEIRSFVRNVGFGINNYDKESDVLEFDEPLSDSLFSPEKLKLDLISDFFLSDLPLPKKMKTFLTNNLQIKTINDFLQLDKTILENKRKLRSKTFLLTQEIILGLLKKNEEQLMYEYSNKSIPILDLIDIFLESIAERDLRIVKRRCEEPESNSLQIIGDEYQLTRERIRQIIFRIIRDLKAKIKTRYLFYAEQFLTIIINQPEPISFKALNRNPLNSRKYKDNIYLGLLSEVFPEVPFRNFTLKSFDQYLNRNLQQSTKTIMLYKKCLEINYPFKKITLEDLFILNNINDTIDKLLLCKVLILSNNFKFISFDGKYYIIKPGPLSQTTRDILESSGEPLALNEIIAIVKTYFILDDKYDNTASIISIFKQDKDIYQLDRYTFGLEKHFSYPKLQWQNICDKTKVCIKKLQRQTNAVELFDYVLPFYPKLRSKYELVYILRSDPDIIDLGFFNFALVDFGSTERLKVSDEIINVFIKNSSPKHFTEIQKEILEKRFLRIEGMSNILNSQTNLINYLGGYWGLKDRNRENLFFLARTESYITNLINFELFPETTVSRIMFYFNDTIKEDQFIDFIHTSSSLAIYEDDNFNQPFIISKKWSIVKIARCILSNSNEPIFWNELLWLLKDKGLTVENSDRYKIKSDKYVKMRGK
jgi:hypothetical protein